MDALKKFFGQPVWSYIVAVIMSVAVGVFRFATLPKGINIRFAWYEILSVSGFVTFLIGALLMVAHWGAFDMFGYVFSPGRGKYHDYADYSQKKTEKRNKEGYFFVPFYVVGVVLVLVSSFLA